MMMPRIFGENLFDDFMNDFDSRILQTVYEKALYGKHAKNLRRQMSKITRTAMK